MFDGALKLIAGVNGFNGHNVVLCAVMRARLWPAENGLFLVNFVEQATIGEVRLLRFLPATKGFINGKGFYLREVFQQCRFHQLRISRAVVMLGDRKSTRLNSSHVRISYAVFCLKKKK